RKSKQSIRRARNPRTKNRRIFFGNVWRGQEVAGTKPDRCFRTRWNENLGRTNWLHRRGRNRDFFSGPKSAPDLESGSGERKIVRHSTLRPGVARYTAT